GGPQDLPGQVVQHVVASPRPGNDGDEAAGASSGTQPASTAVMPSTSPVRRRWARLLSVSENADESGVERRSGCRCG
ncbi:MAG TPA: hypothetical protein VFB74_23350, partial [Kribbellaceae bacterium]|nr:hypothetical protein [Kribbellaceae bacterium]